MADTTDAAEQEVIELGDLDPAEWNDYAEAQGWSDGLPLVMPTESAVERFVAAARGENEPFRPISPRQVVPTLRSLAANAVMAGCRPEYFPVVLSAVRAVLDPAYNLHGVLATTHPCTQMVLVNGPSREALGINCSSNCFGQGWRANASIGRAVQLVMLNVGGARPGDMDRSTQGSPAKFAFCFGENEEESPWEPYHVRRGFDVNDTVVTTMAAEGPHNINDHGSVTGEGLLTTMSATISQPGANTIYRNGPYFVVIGPEHAQTLARDGWQIDSMREAIYERSRVPAARVSKENQASYEGQDIPVEDGHYYLTPSPEDIHIVVAGGPGKHSAYIPSFGGTAASSVQVPLP
ncbi:MAG: hypothetical protein CMQ24_17025 [Gammaproteobacteria bacterium]|nr:hypothetical protein [Gammaproteobacteria bacterium]